MVKTAQKAALLQHNTEKLHSISGKIKLLYFHPVDFSFKHLKDLSHKNKINVANRT
jgi:alkyl hydroperoxide reductase subunit AhpC